MAVQEIKYTKLKNTKTTQVCEMSCLLCLFTTLLPLEQFLSVSLFIWYWPCMESRQQTPAIDLCHDDINREEPYVTIFTKGFPFDVIVRKLN